MKIKTTNYKGDERIESVEAHIARSLDGDREGVAESARSTANNATEALGRLVELLSDKGLLSAADVQFIASSYSTTESQLIPSK